MFEWKTVQDPHGSDHLPIILETNFNPTELVTKHRNKWNVKKANWHRYKEESEILITEINSTTYDEY